MRSARLTRDDLIRMYGDRVRQMTHADYAAVAVAACGGHPATESAVRFAKEDPERRFTNLISGRVLKHLHQMLTGEGSEMNTRDLELM